MLANYLNSIYVTGTTECEPLLSIIVHKRNLRKTKERNQEKGQIILLQKYPTQLWQIKEI